MKRFILTLTACSTLITQSAIAAQTVPNTAIVNWTDTFFYNVNPKLPRGQKLKPTDRAYIREWKAIRPVVQAVLAIKAEKYAL
jgi:Skp family chaperone for outer membrane proteins